MKKLHQFLQIIVLAYFGTFLFFFMGFGTLGPIFGMEEITPNSMTSILLIGLGLLLVHWGIGALMVKGINDKLSQKEQEMVNLKAKLYDLEHPKLVEKKTVELPKASPETSTPSQSPEK
jgi:uncharacterized membrane protein YhaH (DUF805 family)